jgi:hypothetical protein
MNHNPTQPIHRPTQTRQAKYFDRVGESVRGVVDAAFDAAIEVEKQKKIRKVLT